MTNLGKECLYLRGWQPGFNKVQFTSLMQTEVGVSLSAAKDLTDRLLEGKTVVIWVQRRRVVIDQARNLGATVLDYPGSADAD